MKTIILAGGIGKRLQDSCNDKPKPLFKINGKSLLEHSLVALDTVGVQEVNIVTGYKGNMIKEEIGNSFNGIKIDYADNKLYETTGSMHGVYCALKGNINDCLLLDADIIYDPQIIRNLIKDKRKNLAFLMDCCGNGEETYTIIDENDRITYLSLNKTADRDLIKKTKVYEFNGVSKFSEDFLRRMMAIHEGKISSGTPDEYYEECAVKIAKSIPWYGLVGGSMDLAEVDRIEDVERAEQVIELLSKQK